MTGTDIALIPEPEIIETPALSKSQANALDKKIRAANDRVDSNFHALLDMLEDAAKGQIWLALEYDSLAAYVKDAVRFTVIERIERKNLVALMTGTGMSQRVIADALHVSKKTVQNDQADTSIQPEPEDSDAETPPAEQESEPDPATRPRPSLARVFGEDVDELVAAVDTFCAMAEKNIADERFAKARKCIGEKQLDRLNGCAGRIDEIAAALTDE